MPIKILAYTFKFMNLNWLPCDFNLVADQNPDRLSKPPNYLSAEISKCHFLSLVHIHHLPQIRLRKHGKSVSRNSSLLKTPSSPSSHLHEMWDCLKLSPSDQLQCFPGLKGEARGRDGNFSYDVCTGVDVEACCFGRGVGERGERWNVGLRTGSGGLRRVRGMLRFIDIECRGQAGQTAVIDMGRAP